MPSAYFCLELINIETTQRMFAWIFILIKNKSLFSELTHLLVTLLLVKSFLLFDERLHIQWKKTFYVIEIRIALELIASTSKWNSIANKCSVIGWISFVNRSLESSTYIFFQSYGPNRNTLYIFCWSYTEHRSACKNFTNIYSNICAQRMGMNEKSK